MVVVILSSNCIHSTKELHHSCQGLYDLLRPKGMLCLLELTQEVPWLDFIFGLLDRWWRIDDGRGACAWQWVGVEEIAHRSGIGVRGLVKR